MGRGLNAQLNDYPTPTARSIRGRVALAVGATIVGLLVIVWSIQAVLALKATLLEIDAAQSGFASSFAQRAEERIKQLERTLSDSVGTLDLTSDRAAAQIELRRLLRLEPKIVTVTYWADNNAAPVSVMRDQIAPRNMPRPDEHRVHFGQLSIGEVDFDDALGGRVPFKYQRASKFPGGSLSGRLSLALLSELIAEFVSESGSAVFVAFADGRVVAHQNTALAARASPATETSPDSSAWTQLFRPFFRRQLGWS